MNANMAALGIGKGVGEARREEIRGFLTERFERARDTPEKVERCWFWSRFTCGEYKPRTPIPHEYGRTPPIASADN